MARIFYKAKCSNLRTEIVKKLSRYSEARIVNGGDVKGYVCSLTNARCVAAKESFFRWSNDSLDFKTLNRCPGRNKPDIAESL